MPRYKQRISALQMPDYPPPYSRHETERVLKPEEPLKFGEPCVYVMQRLRCQILKWSTCHGCGPRGTRCLYSLHDPRPNDNYTIKATHLTPNIRLVDGIKMIFQKTANNSCTAVATSQSNDWFVIFDYGTNYCNLHNLVVGAGLDTDQNFFESTNNAVCTQLNMASCN
ncbi:uncharacterized protein [Neodiprion pinetum]|uniref:uncharacterized protein n=1 Tax=Neodiprion pinetum TaxID=441929 RepID=UPI001EDF47E3|nr:uncharacterized protein LOC124217337 [Neodiprion pinetum]